MLSIAEVLKATSNILASLSLKDMFVLIELTLIKKKAVRYTLVFIAF